MKHADVDENLHLNHLVRVRRYLRVLSIGSIAFVFAFSGQWAAHSVVSQTSIASGNADTTAEVKKKPKTPLAQLAKLKVKGRAPKTGYSRSQFGSAWKDVDLNGCDTRNDVLARDFITVTFRSGTGNCKVIGGTWTDPYSDVTYTFDHQPSELDADHVVALSDAWQKGAQKLSKERRTAFANDPLNVVVTTATLNRQKGDSDAASWLPPLKSYRCTYVARQIAVKYKYKLWVTSAEKQAMKRVLTSKACSKTKIPSPNKRASSLR